MVIIMSLVGAMMSLAGWEIGVIESIDIAVAAGMSVDYVLHLVHAYGTHLGSPAERARGALADMGVSLTAGAVTTIGALSALFFCHLAWFVLFGQFVVMLLSCAYFTSMVFLPAALAVGGGAKS